ncbi:MAG TPA: GNVR domain-containing protein [Gemmatimonadaceae bacterium]|jgi:uncharacterized protein involved in exopolysaccharide biosynthesis|nr:GNVR domain-containing protein [Gemmatimonadaceae bacterium]
MTAGSVGTGNPANPVRAGRVEGPREETSLLAFLSILLVNRKLIAVCTLAGTLIFGAIAATTADLYVSQASFIVKNTRAPLQLPGGAAALGVSLSSYMEFSQSVAFYADLARAMNILRIVAAEDYVTEDSRGKRVSLPEAMGIRRKDRTQAIEEAAEQLSRDVSYTIGTRTGVVRLSVRGRDPLLAQQVGANIVTEVDKWSKQQGHEQAILERKFMEQLVADARDKLAQAEQAEKNFLEVNRLGATSPELETEFGRITREVTMRQEIYTSLAQTLEQARIDEVRSPQVVNVIESADLPVEPQRREALRTTFTGLAAGLLVGMVLAVLKQRAEEKLAPF